MSGSLQIEEIPDSSHEVAYTGEKPRVKNKITCIEQIEEVLDDSDQRQNNPLHDSNYQLISDIAGITDPEFVDCGETIKHEIKEDGDNEYQIDPLRLFNTPQYFDHSIFSILKGGCTRFEVKYISCNFLLYIKKI